MAATLKTTVIQEPSSGTVNMTLGSTGGVTFGSSITSNTITSAASTALNIQSAGFTAMTIDTSQNVGIGTTSPAAPLHIKGTGQELRLESTGDFTTTGTSYLRFYDTGGAKGYFGYGGTASQMDLQSGPSMNLNINAVGGTFTFSTSNSERMRIDSSGNVGIGTSSPSSRLHVYTSAAEINRLTSTATNGGYQVFYADNTTATYFGSMKAILSTGNASDFAIIGTGSNNLVFGTNSTQAMRLDTSGNLLVGATTYSGSGLSLSSPNGSGCYSIFAAAGTGNHWRFGNVTNGVVGSIQSTTTTTLFNTSSDYRLKENVTPMSTGLATIAALKPVNYDWISDKSAGEGFIAHELAEVIPLAVSGAKDAVDANGKPEYQGVDYSKIVVHLVAALQELSAKVDAQAAEITALQAKVGA